MRNDLQGMHVRIANGDEIAFTDLYKTYNKQLLAFAVSIIRNKECAEEVVEDVFISVWRNRKTVAEIENMAVYLYVAVKNKCLTLLSQKARELVTASFDFIDIQIDEPSNPHSQMVSNEMFSRMRVAVESLPPKCKMVFKLIREDGLKYKEVAAILNISVSTIDKQMAIAVKKICAAMEIENRKFKASRF